MGSNELSVVLKISAPLTFYQLNGNSKTMCLVELGLVKRLHDDNGIPTSFTITELGKEILKLIKL